MTESLLVFDTHDWGHQPGTERTFHRTVPAPADLGIDVYKAAEGTPVELEVRLEAVMEGVLATGSASVHVIGECVRCLDPIEDDIEVTFQELYVFSNPGEDELQIHDDQLDLEPVLTDAVVLALPLNPVCDPQCPGLCAECGARMADDPDHSHGEAIDPRWAKLGQLAKSPHGTELQAQQSQAQKSQAQQSQAQQSQAQKSQAQQPGADDPAGRPTKE